MADRYQNRPYPTDDGYHRGSDFDSPPAESDPLAELARLIGQTDPFGGGMSRANLQPQPAARDQYQQPYYQPPMEEAEEEQPPSPPSWMQRANRREAPPMNYPGPSHPTQGYEDHQSYTQQAYRAEPGFDESHQNYSGQAYQENDYQEQDYSAADHPLRRFGGQHSEPPHEEYRQEHRQERQDYRQDHRQEYQQEHQQEPAFGQAVQPLDRGRYDDALFGPIESSHDDSQYGQGYSNEPYAYQDGYEEEAEEEAPKRRGGLTTIVAILALAVVGTGAAFAYRTFVGSPRNGGAPPVIRADTSPTKIVPASSADGNKAPDRFASADGSEKIVPREETPVDVNANVNSTPRVVFPPPNLGQNPQTVASVTQSVPPANVGNGLMSNSQPRKIKTLTFPGDDADATNSASAATVPVVQQPATKPATAVRTVRTAPASTASAYANANTAPISLAPQAIQGAPAPRQQVATNAPEPIVPTAPGTVSSAYMVQVSSQRNEADAQSSYKVLQGKFPSVLGSRAPTIKRADLGDKGVYYRAMVGPFGSAEEASQFCGGLKSAGGQCVIQRN
jgi:hypothetical protein